MIAILSAVILAIALLLSPAPRDPNLSSVMFADPNVPPESIVYVSVALYTNDIWPTSTPVELHPDRGMQILDATSTAGACHPVGSVWVCSVMTSHDQPAMIYARARVYGCASFVGVTTISGDASTRTGVRLEGCQVYFPLASHEG